MFFKLGSSSSVFRDDKQTKLKNKPPPPPFQKGIDVSWGYLTMALGGPWAPWIFSRLQKMDWSCHCSHPSLITGLVSLGFQGVRSPSKNPGYSIHFKILSKTQIIDVRHHASFFLQISPLVSIHRPSGSGNSVCILGIKPSRTKFWYQLHLLKGRAPNPTKPAGFVFFFSTSDFLQLLPQRHRSSEVVSPSCEIVSWQWKPMSYEKYHLAFHYTGCLMSFNGDPYIKWFIIIAESPGSTIPCIP